ncbi:MAG: hypothetical protein NZ770_02425, partial [Candidatus Poseidoniaceae archaeon]|nr:hypothetical protein [Candidatus Poseidoniaceae archaeon]
MGLFDRFKKKVKSVIDETDIDALSAPDDSEEARQALASKETVDEIVPDPESEPHVDDEWDDIDEISESESEVDDEWDEWDEEIDTAP